MVGRYAPTAAWSDATHRQRHGRTLRTDSGMVGRYAPTAAWSDATHRQRHGRTLRTDSGMVGRYAPTAAWSDATHRQRHGRTLRTDSGMVGRYAPTAAWSDATHRQRHGRTLRTDSGMVGRYAPTAAWSCATRPVGPHRHQTMRIRSWLRPVCLCSSRYRTQRLRAGRGRLLQSSGSGCLRQRSRGAGRVQRRERLPLLGLDRCRPSLRSSHSRAWGSNGRPRWE